MPSPFAVTAASNSVSLDAKRHGEAPFTVFNSSGRPIRGRARLVPENAEASAWLSLAGTAERDFPIASTEQYTVHIAVPRGAPPGSYGFRLDMVGVENPDELFTQGPTITFDVPEASPQKPFPWWVVIAAVAGLILCCAAAIGGYFIYQNWSPKEESSSPTLTPRATAAATRTPRPTHAPAPTPTPTPTHAPSPPVHIILPLDDVNSGSARASSGLLPYAQPGDSSTNQQVYGFLSWNLVPIPAEVQIVEAYITWDSHCFYGGSAGDCTGDRNPFPALGNLWVRAYYYDTLDTGDFAGAGLDGGTLLTSYTTQPTGDLDVTQAVADAHTAGHPFQVYMLFEHSNDGNGYFNGVRFSEDSGANALTVIYQP